MRLNINRAMTFSGRQIRDSRWQARIEYRRLDELVNCVNSGQSVLLTSLHYGSPRAASTIIRSLGVRIASLAHGRLRPLEQHSWNTRVEQWDLQSVPYIFYPTDMLEIKDWFEVTWRYWFQRNNVLDLLGAICPPPPAAGG